MPQSEINRYHSWCCICHSDALQVLSMQKRRASIRLSTASWSSSALLIEDKDEQHERRAAALWLPGHDMQSDLGEDCQDAGQHEQGAAALYLPGHVLESDLGEDF